MKITGINLGTPAIPAALSETDLRALRDRADFINPNLGPITRVTSFLGMGTKAGGSYSGHSELFDLDGLLRDIFGSPSMEPGVNDTLFGGGKGFDLASTALSSSGEAIERVGAALSSCDPDARGGTILGSYDELTEQGFPLLDPREVTLFSEEQYASPGFLYEPFTRQTRIQWSRGVRALARSTVFVPTQLSSMVHIYDPSEAVVGYPVSGGLCCQTSYDAALYGGLCEVLERDAINVSWYTPRLPRQVALDSLPAELDDFVARLVDDNSLARLLYHPTAVPGIACFSFVSQQHWLPRRRYCAGGACELDPLAALQSAAVEHGQSRSIVDLAIFAPRGVSGRTVEKMFDWDPTRSLAEMELFIQAIGYYGNPAFEAELDDYLNGPVLTWDELQAELAEPRANWPTGLSDTETLLAACELAGLDPVVLDFSLPQYRQLAILKVFEPRLTTGFLQSRPVLGHARLDPLRDGIMGADGYPKPLPYP